MVQRALLKKRHNTLQERPAWPKISKRISASACIEGACIEGACIERVESYNCRIQAPDTI